MDTKISRNVGTVIKDFLSKEELAGINKRLNESKVFLIDREKAHIKTLGRVWYLDIEAGFLPLYHWEAAQTNSVVSKVISPKIKERLLAKIQDILPIPSYLKPSKPTIPLFSRKDVRKEPWVDMGLVRVKPTLINGRYEDTGGIAHADMEGLSPYPNMLFATSKVYAFSIIVCLALPEEGGSLELWKEIGAYNKWTVDSKPQVLEYSPGSLAIFDSRRYHRIMASVYSKRNPARSILGVHVLFVDDPTNGPHYQYWF